MIRTTHGETTHIAYSGDSSPIYPHWRAGNYDPHCSCCWHGFPHTEEKHRASLMLSWTGELSHAWRNRRRACGDGLAYSRGLIRHACRRLRELRAAIA